MGWGELGIAPGCKTINSPPLRSRQLFGKALTYYWPTRCRYSRLVIPRISEADCVFLERARFEQTGMQLLENIGGSGVRMGSVSAHRYPRCG